MKRILKMFALIAVLSSVFGRNVLANSTTIPTGYSGGVSTGQTIASGYQNFILPKFPPTTHTSSTGFSSHFQMHRIDANVYNFIYFNATRVVIFGVMKYEVEVSYQIVDSSGFHDGFLKDYGFPGDSIGYFYTDAGAVNSARIVNDGSSGHGSWDHSGTFSWTGVHPDSYISPQWFWTVNINLLTGPECLKDMPAQDVPGSSSHISTMNVLTAVTLIDGTLQSLPALPTGTTTCSVAVNNGTYGPYTYSAITAQGGG